MATNPPFILKAKDIDLPVAEVSIFTDKNDNKKELICLTCYNY